MIKSDKFKKLIDLKEANQVQNIRPKGISVIKMQRWMENKKKLIIFVVDNIFNNDELLFSISILEKSIKYKDTNFLHGKSMAKTYIEGWSNTPTSDQCGRGLNHAM